MSCRSPNKVTGKWFRVPSQRDQQDTYTGLAAFIAEVNTAGFAAGRCIDGVAGLLVPQVCA